MLFPEAVTDFRVYLRQNNNYVLYTREQQRLDISHRQRLSELGVDTVYVLGDQRKAFEDYLEDNLGSLLENPDLPEKERAQVFYDASRDVVRRLFDDGLGSVLTPDACERLNKLVDSTVCYLTKPSSLRNLGGLISHTYETFTHSLHVYVYASAVFRAMGMGQHKMRTYGLGAMLHDFGKTRVPKEVLHKPGKLTDEEFAIIKRHPTDGAALCASLDLSPQVSSCMLLHHEKLDGSGYPSGLSGDEIPLPIRVVTACDIYDALTSNRCYAKARAPYEALSIMRNEMDGQLDPEVFRCLVEVLSGAKML